MTTRKTTLMESRGVWVTSHLYGRQQRHNKTLHRDRCAAGELVVVPQARNAREMEMNRIEHFDGEREDGMIFRFTGDINNRPCGRGICIGENHDYLEEQFPEGDFEAEIVIRRKGARDNFGKET